MVWRKPRIGLILSSVPAYSETFFVSKIEGLAKRGYSITLLARGKNKTRLPVKLINPWPIPGSIGLRILLAMFVLPLVFIRAPRATIRLWSLEKSGGSGVIGRLRSIYANGHILPLRLDWLSFGFATQALGRECVARAIGARMAVSLRGYDIQVYPLKYPNCYKRVWHYVDRVHALSSALVKDAQLCGLPEKTFRQIIPPAIDTQKAEPLVPLSWDGQLSLVTVARLHWVKGVDISLRALSLLKSKGVDFQYHVIGDGEAYEQLLFLANQLGLTDRVVFHGRMSPARTFSFLRRCHVYLQPSLTEGFCNALLEAQLHGCFCIASDTGGIPENVIHGKTGLLVPPGNPIALAEAICDFLTWPLQKKKAASVEASLRIKKHFGLSSQLEHWLGFYELK